jgi:hypothetical protein
MFCSLLASGLHRVLEFDRAHLGLPLSRLALYSRRETIEWTCAWSFGKGFIKLGSGLTLFDKRALICDLIRHIFSARNSASFGFMSARKPTLRVICVTLNDVKNALVPAPAGISPAAAAEQK